MERSITLRIALPDSAIRREFASREPAEQFAFTIQQILVEACPGLSIRGVQIDRRGTQPVHEKGSELEHELDRILGKYLTPGPPIAVKDHVAIVHGQMDRGDLVSDLAELVRRLASL